MPVTHVLTIVAAMYAAVALASPAGASDASVGRQKAQMCAPCHGVDGIAKMPDAPNLAGESSIYTIRQLRLFRDGERRHEQMSIIAQALSDEDIADLAAWYESIEVSVELPE